MGPVANVHADTLLIVGDSLSAAHGIEREAGWVAPAARAFRSFFDEVWRDWRQHSQKTVEDLFEDTAAITAV